MQETPPYSIAEIRLLLSEYLDGALAPEQMVNLDTLMEQFPQYREEFLKLQATRDAIQRSLEQPDETQQLHYTKISDMVWKNIANRLEADKDQEPQDYEAEFVSAYYDGEIPADAPERQAFESQLLQNAQANELLSQIGQVSESVRRVGYQLENACTLDVTSQVMAAFMHEQGKTDSDAGSNTVDSTLDAPVDPDLEMISAYADQELSARETIEINRLIESREDARLTLHRFNHLSEQIQAFSERLQAQAPELWPVIEPTLQKTVDQGGIIVPISRAKRLRERLKIAVPVAAAAVMLFLTLPSLQGGDDSAGRLANRSAQTGNTHLMSYRIESGSTELASVPVGSFGAQQVRFASQEDSMDAMGEATALSTPPRPIRPILEPSSKIAARPGVPMDGEETASAKAPTSEEYLFNALNEQMPDEDISNILGK